MTVPATPAGADKIALANDLHRQCTGLADRVQALGQRMWQTAVALGYTLMRIKAELPHGEYSKLFASKSDTCAAFEFGLRSAQRYVSLYKSVEARVRKMGDDRVAAMRQMIEQGAADELDLILGDVIQAASIREAYIELGVIRAPKTPSEAMMDNRHTAGRPKGSVPLPNTWDEEHELARHRAAELACGLDDYIARGRLAYLTASEIAGLRASVATSLAAIKSYRPTEAQRMAQPPA